MNGEQLEEMSSFENMDATTPTIEPAWEIYYEETRTMFEVTGASLGRVKIIWKANNISGANKIKLAKNLVVIIGPTNQWI